MGKDNEPTLNEASTCIVGYMLPTMCLAIAGPGKCVICRANKPQSAGPKRVNT